MPGIDAAACVAALSHEGLYISKGSACHANEREPSRVLLALGLNEDLALGSIRISMGIWTEEDAVKKLASALVRYIENERCHKSESPG